MRKPLITVQSLLTTRRERERFCVLPYHFHEAVAELRWQHEAVRVGGARKWHVGPSGNFELWRWGGAWGDEVPADVLQWASDASKWGGGYVFEEEYRVREWTDEERAQHINILECFMVLQIAIDISPHCRGRRCIGWNDNTTTVQAINTGRSRSNVLMQLVRHIHLEFLRYDMQVWMMHIPGVHNIKADGLSRGVLGQRVSNWSLVPQCMERCVCLGGGAFTVDAFSDEAGSNSQAPRFRSLTSPPDFSFTDERVWAFPPPTLAEQFLELAPTW